MKQPNQTKPGAVYICGPITGLPLNNAPEFSRIQEQLDAENIPNINPHEIFEGIDVVEFKHADYMKHCISYLAFCDKVITLKGWESSVGATMEVRIARSMGKEVIIADVFIKQLKAKNAHVN